MFDRRKREAVYTCSCSLYCSNLLRLTFSVQVLRQPIICKLRVLYYLEEAGVYGLFNDDVLFLNSWGALLNIFKVVAQLPVVTLWLQSFCPNVMLVTSHPHITGHVLTNRSTYLKHYLPPMILFLCYGLSYTFAKISKGLGMGSFAI